MDYADSQQCCVGARIVTAELHRLEAQKLGVLSRRSSFDPPACACVSCRKKIWPRSATLPVLAVGLGSSCEDEAAYDKVVSAVCRLKDRPAEIDGVRVRDAIVHLLTVFSDHDGNARTVPLRETRRWRAERLLCALVQAEQVRRTRACDDQRKGKTPRGILAESRTYAWELSVLEKGVRSGLSKFVRVVIDLIGPIPEHQGKSIQGQISWVLDTAMSLTPYLSWRTLEVYCGTHVQDVRIASGRFRSIVVDLLDFCERRQLLSSHLIDSSMRSCVAFAQDPFMLATLARHATCGGLLADNTRSAFDLVRLATRCFCHAGRDAEPYPEQLLLTGLELGVKFDFASILNEIVPPLPPAAGRKGGQTGAPSQLLSERLSRSLVNAYVLLFRAGALSSRRTYRAWVTRLATEQLRREATDLLHGDMLSLKCTAARTIRRCLNVFIPQALSGLPISTAMKRYISHGVLVHGVQLSTIRSELIHSEVHAGWAAEPHSADFEAP